MDEERIRKVWWMVAVGVRVGVMSLEEWDQWRQREGFTQEEMEDAWNTTPHQLYQAIANLRGKENYA